MRIGLGGPANNYNTASGAAWDWGTYDNYWMIDLTRQMPLTASRQE